MRIISFLLFLLGVSNITYGQTNYKNGHVVYKNSTSKISGVFKKVEWDYPPTSIYFKGDSDKRFSLIQTLDLNEFGIDNESKYVIRNVALDKSTDDDSKLTLTPDLKLEQAVLTLEVVVEGDKTLYKYENDDFERFFYSTDKVEITQLYYKKYNLIVNENKEIVFKPKENTGYILQLRKDISCNSNDSEEVLPTYNLESLKEYFIKSNQCGLQEAVSYISTYDKALFNLNIIGGINSSQISATSFGYNPDYDFAEYESSLSYLIGVGLEVTAPSKKTSLILEVIYNTPYTAMAQVITIPIPLGTTPTPEPIETSYSYLRSSLGAKYFLFLSNKSSFYVVGNVLADIPIDSRMLVHPEIVKTGFFSSEPRLAEYKSVVANVALGVGLKISKLSIEIKTSPKSNITRNDLESKFSNSLLKLNYSFL